MKKGSVNFNLVENVKEEFVSQKILKDKDILILSSAHQAEYLGRNPCMTTIPKELENEDITFVGELINIRANKDIVNPYYLLQLFNTKNYYLLINREKRGQTSHLYPKDMKTILVPIPADLEIQNKYADAYVKNYQEYIRLTKEAEILLKKTYKDFEDEFLS